MFVLAMNAILVTFWIKNHHHVCTCSSETLITHKIEKACLQFLGKTIFRRNNAEISMQGPFPLAATGNGSCYASSIRWCRVIHYNAKHCSDNLKISHGNLIERFGYKNLDSAPSSIFFSSISVFKFSNSTKLKPEKREPIQAPHSQSLLLL